ncbi:MAG: protein-glutamate O-methyltransferase CheR [Pseudomonadota bacterium]
MSLPEEITAESFLRFRDFFYHKTGMYFDERKRYFVDHRLLERLKATGAQNFNDYFLMLRLGQSDDELQHLINLMTTNETYFFREEYQFKCLVNSLLPEIVKTKGKGEPIRIWSIPSASGEEPYSLAIYLLEYWAQVDEYEIELHASDIDTNMLMQAQRGSYLKRALQNLPPHIIENYFTQDANGLHHISADLKNSISFTTVNITNPAQTLPYQNFDIIFCRNLFIYFDDLSRRMAAQTFYDALVPGGFICLGHAESMSRISPLFNPRRFPDGIVYQKPVD